MAFDCVDVNLDRTPVDNTGDWWDSPLGWASWLGALNSRGELDNFHLCIDHAYLRDRYTYENTYNITASGTVNGRLYVKMGNIGARFESSVSQDSWWFVGSRPAPFRRQQWKGVVLLSLTSSYISIEGVKARNYHTVMNFVNPVQNSALMNCIFKNATYGAKYEKPVSGLTIDQIVGRDITASLLVFDESISDSTITNVTAINTNVEDGEAIAVRLKGENNHNVKIKNIISGGQHDHYIASIPKDPFHDNSQYKKYTQGEVLAIEGGSNIEIERVIGFNCTDRIIDCKAQCVIRDSGGVTSKRGITMWADNSHAINCVIHSSVGVSSTGATAYLMFGNNSILEDCYAHMLERSNNSTVLVREGASYTIIRGEYTQPSYDPFLVSSSHPYSTGPATIELIDVVINGVTYNETITLANAGDKWYPN